VFKINYDTVRFRLTGLFECLPLVVSIINNSKSKETLMTDGEIILNELMDALGEEGCGVSCEEATIFRDGDGWKMMLEGFMEPWKLGQTAEEARANIREYASMGFGLA
jgi:hypothetical protein